MYDGIENAAVTHKLPHIEPGKYTFKVEALKRVKSRKGAEYTVGEFTVVERHTGTGNEKGTKASLMIRESLDNALGQIKNLFCSILGEPETALTKTKAEALVSDKNPAAGRLVEAEAFNITKRDGGLYTKVTFAPANRTK